MVDDHGLEVIRKAAVPLDPAKPKANYVLQTTSKNIVQNKQATYSAFHSEIVAQETLLSDYRFDSETLQQQFNIINTGFGLYTFPVGNTGLILKTGAFQNSGISIFSKKIHKYRSGVGTKLKLSTITFDLGVAGNKREWGLISEDDQNGAFLRLNGTNLYLVIKNNGVETQILSSAFNVPVVHTGFNNHYYIQMQWLGTGPIYLYRNADRVHTYDTTNTVTDFTIGNPDLRVFYKNENTTNPTNIEMMLGCASVVAEGGTTAREISEAPEPDDLAVLTKTVLSGKGETEYVNINATDKNEILSYSRQNDDQFYENKTQFEVLDDIKKELRMHTVILKEAFGLNSLTLNDLE